MTAGYGVAAGLLVYKQFASMNKSVKSSLAYLAGIIAISLGIGAAGGWLFGSAVSYVVSIFRPGIKEADLRILFFIAFCVPLLVGAAIAISESIRAGRIVRNLRATGVKD
jgi:formate/nitrite transporter FocA (FNT family)